MSKWNVDARIMRLRGLGFSQKEISTILHVSQATISYKLQELKERCKEESVDTVFFEMCTKLYLPKLLRLLK